MQYNNETLSVRVTEEQKKLIEQAALSERRSISNWLRVLLEQRLDKKQAA